MERRKSERTAVSHSGTLTLDSTQFSCKVRDVSGAGAMLVFSKAAGNVPTYEDMEYEGKLTIASGPKAMKDKKALVVRFNETETELFLAVGFF